MPAFAPILAAQSPPEQVLFGGILGIGGLLLLAFWVWMAIDCLLHEPPGTSKTAWLLALLLGSWIGALFYFFLQRRERLREGREETGTAKSPFGPRSGPIPNPPARHPAKPPVVIDPPVQAEKPLPPASSGMKAGVLVAVIGVLLVLPCLGFGTVGLVMLAVGLHNWRQLDREVMIERSGWEELERMDRAPLPPEIPPFPAERDTHHDMHQQMMEEFERARAEAERDFEARRAEMERRRVEMQRRIEQSHRRFREHAAGLP